MMHNKYSISQKHPIPDTSMHSLLIHRKEYAVSYFAKSIVAEYPNKVGTSYQIID